MNHNGLKFLDVPLGSVNQLVILPLNSTSLDVAAMLNRVDAKHLEPRACLDLLIVVVHNLLLYLLRNHDLLLRLDIRWFCCILYRGYDVVEKTHFDSN